MFQRERLAVHRDREHGVTTIHDDRGRRADGEPIDGPGDDLVRARVDTGLPEEIGERRPDPPGVADVATTDRVRDARQGHVALHQGSRQQRGVVERQLVANHAVDPEAPSLGGDRRDEQRCVHPIEDVVRRDERSEAGDAQVGARRRRRGATSAGAGILTAARDVFASARRIRNRPARPETAASPAAPAPARRNRRRLQSTMGRLRRHRQFP